MRISIDAAGRVVIPKALRDRAGIRGGMALEAHIVAGRVVLEPAADPVRLERRGRWVVAVPEDGAAPALTQRTVDATLDALRGEYDGGAD